LWDPE